jgi:hypothetical protein
LLTRAQRAILFCHRPPSDHTLFIANRVSASRQHSSSPSPYELPMSTRSCTSRWLPTASFPPFPRPGHDCLACCDLSRSHHLTIYLNDFSLLHRSCFAFSNSVLSQFRKQLTLPYPLHLFCLDIWPARKHSYISSDRRQSIS